MMLAVDIGNTTVVMGAFFGESDQPRWVRRMPTRHDFTPEQWLDYIRQENITALVCYNDYLAVKCYHLFDSRGIRVAQDVSVVGFDDTEISRTALPRTALPWPCGPHFQKAAAPEHGAITSQAHGDVLVN